MHARRSTLTGIDRVEHAYVKHLLYERSPTSDLWFVVNTPFGQGAISPKKMREIFETIELWQNDRSHTDDSSTYCQLLTALREPAGGVRNVPLSLRDKNSLERDNLRGVAQSLLTGGFRFKKLMSDHKPSVYLNTSHILLDKPMCFRWLQKREILPFFLIHDLIPIEFPEFCMPGADVRHAVRMETILQFAKGVITNSNFTRSSFLRFAAGRSTPQIEVVPLANTIRDEAKHGERTLNLSGQYFLHVGTIEGRKNIGHLLNVWRDVIARMGPSLAPRLVLVGRRGWECDNVISMLDRSKELANHVIEVSGISDDELECLMLNASALITVSLTEGYGLPPVEALQIGTPVIASDIQAHREVLGDSCDYVSPHDGEALASLVIKATMTPRADVRRHGITPLSWEDHVKKSLEFIELVYEEHLVK